MSIIRDYKNKGTLPISLRSSFAPEQIQIVKFLDVLPQIIKLPKNNYFRNVHFFYLKFSPVIDRKKLKHKRGFTCGKSVLRINESYKCRHITFNLNIK